MVAARGESVQVGCAHHRRVHAPGVGGLFAAYAAFYTTLLCAMAGSWRGMWLGRCSQELSRSAFALRSLSVDRIYSTVM